MRARALSRGRTEKLAQRWLVRSWRSVKIQKNGPRPPHGSIASFALRARSIVVRKQRAGKPLSLSPSCSVRPVVRPVHHWARDDDPSMESSPVCSVIRCIIGLAMISRWSPLLASQGFGRRIHDQLAAGGWPAEFSFWTAQPKLPAQATSQNRNAMGSSCPGRKHPSLLLPTHSMLRKRMHYADR